MGYKVWHQRGIASRLLRAYSESSCEYGRSESRTSLGKTMHVVRWIVLLWGGCGALNLACLAGGYYRHKPAEPSPSATGKLR